MKGQSLVVFHYFCLSCEVPIANKDVNCDNCGEDTKVSYFLELPLIKQLQTMFSREDFYNALQFRFMRNKQNENHIEDIYDGEIHKAEMAENGFFAKPQQHKLYVVYGWNCNLQI